MVVKCLLVGIDFIEKDFMRIVTIGRDIEAVAIGFPLKGIFRLLTHPAAELLEIFRLDDKNNGYDEQ